MDALLKWHGLSKDDWYSLAFKLAEPLVPGLRLKAGKPVGASITKWDPWRIAQAHVDIASLRKKRPQLSIKDAAGILVKTTWRGTGARAEDLRRRYSKADPWLVLLIEQRESLVHE
jgi:hypothetical protein